MESLHEPDEIILDKLVSYFNPRWAEQPFLPMLAHWVDIDKIYPQFDTVDLGPDWTVDVGSADTGRMRELIALAPRLAQLRGTAQGLKLFLEAATGLAFHVEDPVADAEGFNIPFHVRVVAPREAESQRELVERVIGIQIPAYVTYELIFAPKTADAGKAGDRQPEDGTDGT
jgi:hypothetical protein